MFVGRILLFLYNFTLFHCTALSVYVQFCIIIQKIIVGNAILKFSESSRFTFQRFQEHVRQQKVDKTAIKSEKLSHKKSKILSQKLFWNVHFMKGEFQ